LKPLSNDSETDFDAQGKEGVFGHVEALGVAPRMETVRVLLEEERA
tara:strand:+ start:150 stop:287 length:138 start_codon:yes stop_codon:yes gene_type:complete